MTPAAAQTGIAPRTNSTCSSVPACTPARTGIAPRTQLHLLVGPGLHPRADRHRRIFHTSGIS